MLEYKTNIEKKLKDIDKYDNLIENKSIHDIAKKGVLNNHTIFNIWWDSVNYSINADKHNTVINNGNVYSICGKRAYILHYKHSIKPLLKNITKNVDCVIEIGNGWGSNLLYIINTVKRTNIDYYLYTTDDNYMYNILKINLKKYNIFINKINPANPKINIKQSYSNVLIYTYCGMGNKCVIGTKLLPQLMQIPNNFKVIHIEPIGWQIYDKHTYNQPNHTLSIKNKTNKTNLYNQLQKLRSSDRILIDNVAIDYCGFGKANNALTSITWHPGSLIKKVVHQIHPISKRNHIYRFKRTILQYVDTKLVKYYVIMPAIFSKINMYSKHKKYTTLYYSTCNDIVKTINKLRPMAIILTISPRNYTFMNNITCKNYYYIHHGLVTSEHVNFKKGRWNKNFKYIIGCKKLYRDLGKCFGTTKNFIKINGLPQFDIILNDRKRKLTKNKRTKIYKYYNIDPAKKTILIPTAGGIYNKTDTVMKKIKNVINSTNIQYHIFIKNKVGSYNKYFSEMGANVTCLMDTNNFYDFLYCDYIVVEEGGTAFVEGLMVNRKTILYQVDNPNDYYDISDKYGLLIAKTMNQFIKYVNMVINDDPYLNSKKYILGIKAFIHDSIGEIEMVSNKIIDIVTKN